jgi:hypothetical protein
MSIETRQMRRAYSVEVKTVHVGPDSTPKAQFVIFGESPTGRDIKFTINATFSQWPCLFRSFSEAWEKERQSREAEIARIAATVKAAQ